MSRVTENSSQSTINFAVGRVKGKLEDLQLKGSTLKQIMKPSDDPVGNVDLLAIRSQKIDSNQYKRNINFAQSQLSFTENVLNGISDLLNKAKELAIGQASSIYSPEIREGVSKEIHQIRLQLLSMANKRVGNRYIFSGQKILTRPFDKDGNYFGDTQKINLEINKDLFIPINVTGEDLFFSKEKRRPLRADVDLNPTDYKIPPDDVSPEISVMRKPASINGSPEDNSLNNQQFDSSQPVKTSLFDDLRSLENALVTDNPVIIQSLLEKLDSALERVISHRTQLGALINTISNAEINIDKNFITNEEQKSKIEDADVAELFANLQKEQNILKATYNASSKMMNTSLMDFLK